jgi:hypothetical protein
MHVAQGAVRDEALVEEAPHGGFVGLIDGGDQRFHDCLVRHQLSACSRVVCRGAHSGVT